MLIFMYSASFYHPELDYDTHNKHDFANLELFDANVFYDITDCEL